MEKDFLNIKYTQAKIFEKIEELTLSVIKLQKQINKLKNSRRFHFVKKIIFNSDFWPELHNYRLNVNNL
jgi:hypothetical protein